MPTMPRMPVHNIPPPREHLPGESSSEEEEQQGENFDEAEYRHAIDAWTAKMKRDQEERVANEKIGWLGALGTLVGVDPLRKKRDIGIKKKQGVNDFIV